MDIQEYIASGVLELYAAGALTPAEMAEVERMAALHPSVREELHAISETLDNYARLHAVRPPDHLKEKILNQVLISGKETLRAGISDELPATDFKQFNLTAVPVSEVERPASYFNWLAVAASVLLLVSAGLNFYFYNNWQRSENQYQVAVATQNQYARNVQQVRQQLVLETSKLAVITDNQTQKVSLKGMKKSPSSSVAVYWNKNSKEVFVKVADLPAPPSGRQYQLWALENGLPIDAGMLDISADSVSVQKMKIISNAQAFAITLEPQGGSKNPTLDEMYVMGQI